MVKTKTGKVYMFGQNENGQLGLGEKFANRPKDVLDATEIIINK